MTELIYRVLFVIIFATFWMVRLYYVRKTRDPHAPRSREERRAAMKKEGWTGILLIVLMPIELILIMLFLWGPTWMAWANLLFPFWLHWAGVSLLILIFFDYVTPPVGEHKISGIVVIKHGRFRKRKRSYRIHYEFVKK